MIDQVSERAHALWYVGPNRAEIRRETLPADVGAGEVRIEASSRRLGREVDGRLDSRDPVQRLFDARRTRGAECRLATEESVDGS